LDKKSTKKHVDEAYVLYRCLLKHQALGSNKALELGADPSGCEMTYIMQDQYQKPKI
jgi:hypothetical protein